MLENEGIWGHYSSFLFSSVTGFNKYKMCLNWFKMLENESIRALFKGFPIFHQ
jgi:hypothetical protein